MNTKSMIKSGIEVMDATQLSKINGGRTIVIYIEGKRVLIEVPD